MYKKRITNNNTRIIIIRENNKRAYIYILLSYRDSYDFSNHINNLQIAKKPIICCLKNRKINYSKCMKLLINK